MFVEVNTTLKNEKKWINYDHFRMNPYHNPNINDQCDEPFEVVELCGNRSYLAFTQLCGVRSHYDNPQCISPPKGIPDDISEYVRAAIESYGIDGHSHSYVTLKEIREFRENLKPMKLKGMISPEQAKQLDEKQIAPESWCGWTNREGFVFREWQSRIDALENIHNKLKERAIERYWTEENIEEDNIRIVFFFDN